MTAIALPRPVHADQIRAGLMTALVFALYADVPQFEASRECRGGAFSAGRMASMCAAANLVVRRIGSDLGVRVPLPQ